VSFQDVVMMGLADDGGLTVPQSIPDAKGLLARWRTLSYNELALEVLGLFIEDIPTGDLRSMIERSYGPSYGGEVAPVVKVGSRFIVELWHGPTLAFKDVALQLLGNLFEYILARRGGSLNILGATSGDTGSAAIYGVRGRRGMHIFVMHPHKAVSPIQERQMTTVLDANVHNIAIKGSFDDCQRIMKQLAGDLEFKRRYSLGAVNSVNWARVLAQIVYYFRAVFEVQAATGAQTVQVAVPTGNFGDVLAGWYAKRMGCPISRLILATNENDILARFVATGTYSAGKVVQTLSPSMDIQVASNFERYLWYRLRCDGAKLSALMDQFARTGALSVPGPQEDFAAGVGTRGRTLEIIGEYYKRHGYVLDPHTAVGVAVSHDLPAGPDDPIACLATAHPAKFPDAIRQATGLDVARHPAIDRLLDLPTRCEVAPNDPLAVREFIEKTLA
jgi:threonine synthase